MSDEEDNIVSIDFGRQVSFERRYEPRFCRHRAKWIDQASRKVGCSNCGEELDPFNELVSISSEWATYKRAGEEYKKDCLAVQERLVDLQRQERNAKARLKKAENRDPVEEFKTDLLDKIAGSIDLAHEKGEYIHKDQLRALGIISRHILPGHAQSSFEIKIGAAIAEIEAREKRQRLHVSGRKKQHQSRMDINKKRGG